MSRPSCGKASLFCAGIAACAALLASSAMAQPDGVKRGWGPEQAVGKPDTPEAGDQTTAWASLSPDDQQEWLICEYDAAVMIKQISVHETYNPGALIKVTAFNSDGEEVLAWEGEDPTPRDQAKGVSVIPVKLEFPVRKIKLFIDSPAVPGWNEIDAVSLLDNDGNEHWAIAANASTTYAAPNATAEGKRNWGPEQAEGEPDTPGAGDIVTAWASASPDGMKEWLQCEFEGKSKPAEIIVHETFNPGAIYKITAYNEQGEEVLAWEGEDPTPRDQPRGVSVFPVKLDFAFSKVRIYIDSPAVPGWNEIDAVGLRDEKEDTQWTKKVEASSTFAAPQPLAELISVPAQRVMELEQQIQALQAQVAELKQLKEEFKELKDSLKNRKRKKQPANE